MNLTNANPALFAALAKAQAEVGYEAEAAAIKAIVQRREVSAGWQHSTRPLAVRLLERVVFGATGCWHWNSTDNGHGYGRMTYMGRSQVAHRLAWMAWNGDIPEGMSVLHKCDNRACINPEHLWLGTYSDNLADCWAKGRHPGRGGNNRVN